MYFLLFYFFKALNIFMSSSLDNSNCIPLKGPSLNNLVFLVWCSAYCHHSYKRFMCLSHFMNKYFLKGVIAHTLRNAFQ